MSFPSSENPSAQSQPAQSLPADVLQVQQEIDQALAEFAAMADGDLQPADFYAGLLERVVGVTSATGAAIWIVGAGDALHLFRQHGLARVLGGRKPAAVDRERQRLTHWLEEAESNEPPVMDSTIIARVQPAGSLWALLTVYLPEEATPAARLGLQRFVDAAAAAATDYQARRELRHWNQDRDALSRLHDLTMAVHRPWSQTEVLGEIASEGRRFLDCDRVIVAVRRVGRYRIAAASGAATLNRRSAELQNLERLTRAVARLRQPFFYEESASATERDARPPQIDAPLQRYLDESAARRLALVPLASPSQPDSTRPTAVLVVEQMSDRPLDAASQSVWLLAEHAAVAVDRATRVRRLPVIGPLLGVESLRRVLTRRWLPRGLLALAAVGSLISALLLVKTEHTVRVTGELAPAVQRNVFAPTDGVVVELHVEHGQQVAAGELLATLRSADVELETTRLRGAIATAEQKLAAVRTARLEAMARGAGSQTGRSQGQLASEALVIEQELESLRSELALVDAERKSLAVTSPIDGEIVTWDLRETLTARPVRRGQRMLTVADLSDEWRIRFRAADRDAAPILDTNRSTIGGATIRFVTAARPEEEFRAQASAFRLASEPDPTTGENQLLFEATLAADASPELRPGAEVVGQVECGQRSLAYVWLGGLYEELRRRFF